MLYFPIARYGISSPGFATNGRFWSGSEPVRFKELQREIPDISQKMLTVTLRTLEEDGYVTRTIYPEVPPRVEYALTERTHSLLPHINSLIAWALENRDSIIKDRKTFIGKSRN